MKRLNELRDNIINEMKNAQNNVKKYCDLLNKQTEMFKNYYYNSENPPHFKGKIFTDKRALKLMEIISHEQKLQNNKHINLTQIANKYTQISGISLTRMPSGKEIKIDLTFLNTTAQSNFIVLSLDKNTFNITDISPKEIDYTPYLTELNETEDLNSFLSNIITKEYIIRNENKKSHK